jgi:hypothetical protein
MADRYIDIFEVSEYGDFFLTVVASLENKSELVNISALSKKVRDAKEKVEAERAKAGLTRKTSTPEEAITAATALRAQLTRFHSFLNSLDPDEHLIDPTKFFPKNILGGLQQLKPDDVKARAEKISEAFLLEAYKNSEVLAPWKKKIEGAQQTLSQALKSKIESRNETITLTTSLAAAREEFLHIYNGVAKNLVRGLLHELARGDEYSNFFKDLQVNEDKPASKPSTDTPPQE